MQTTYPTSLTKAFVGMPADSGPSNTMSYTAEEAIPFGRGVMLSADGLARLPNKNQATITWDADFVTSNTINGSVNGDAITQVTFSTNQATTIALVAAAIEDLDDDLTATVTAARVITVSYSAGDLTVGNFTVAAGSSQATETVAYTNSEIFAGISVAAQTVEQDADGVVQYAATDTIPARTVGRMRVYAEQDIALGDPVYMRIEANGANKYPGQFRMDSDSSKAILMSSMRWTEGASSGGIATLEINIP